MFPCQQFGGQELSTGEEVLQFAEKKQFEGTVMSIDDVVGENARPSWKHFYSSTNAPEPTWNFKGQFLVSRSGNVIVPSADLEGDIKKLLEEEAAEL